MNPTEKNNAIPLWRQWRRLPGPLLALAVAVTVGVVWFLGSRVVVRPRLVCTVAAAPFKEILHVPGEVDCGVFQDVRAPEAPYERQITWLIPEGTVVKAGDILAQFDTGDADENRELKVEKVATLENLRETETIKWGIDLTTEKVRKDQKEETRSNARLMKEGTKLQPPLPREIGEIKFGVANLTAEEAARRISQLERMSAYELRRRQHHIRYWQARVQREDAYIEEYIVRSPADSVVLYPPIPLAGGLVRQAESGDFLARDQVFIRLPDFSTRVVRLQVPEHAVQQVATNATLTFTARAFPGRSYKARVSNISNLAIQNLNRPHQKHFEVVAQILPGQGIEELKPGMVVEAEFMVRDHGVVFAIPKDLAVATGGGVSLQLETGWGRIKTVTLDQGFTKTGDHVLVSPALLPVKAAGELRVLFLN